jgi:preprotein translocase subunit YajC
VYSTFLSGLLLLAAEAAEPPAPLPQAAPAGNFWIQIAPFVAIGLLFYFMLIRPQGREQARRREMLKAVKRTDRVLTNSGIFGVVTNIDPEAGEITIKVDEATNTKLRMTLSSVAQVLSNEPSGTSDSK